MHINILNFLCFFFFFYVLAEYWKAYKFKFRISWWLWDFYRYDENFYKTLKARGAYIPTNFKERTWLQDSWTRIESGGNVYTRWYENFYRELKNLPLKN